MIERIKLTNFKCFNSTQIELRPLTILAGANAVGKSTVIQALILTDYTNRMGKKEGKERNSIDINDVFGFPVGAPNALVSQNPQDTEAFDFSIDLYEEKNWYIYNYGIDRNFPLELRFENKKGLPKRNLQYLNAERVGPRVSNQAGKGEGIVFNGDNAAYLTEVADRTKRIIAEQLKGDIKESNKFSYYVEKWMSAILGEMQLDIHTDYNKAITELRIKNELVDAGIVPTLTGFGISYVLPIVVAGLWATGEEQSLLILENPEAHLHPYAQSNMGKFLALLAASGVQVIVETHSEHIIDGARYQMAVMGAEEKAIVNFLESNEGNIRITPIFVSERGELSSWPKGFLDRKQMDLRDIMMLRKKNV